MTNLHNAIALVGRSGAQLTVTTSDGEILFEVGLPAGKHRLAEYASFVGPDDDVTIEGGTILVPSVQRVTTMAYGAGSMDSGANPDFRPTSMDQAAKRMEKMLSQLVQKSAAQDRKLAALQAERDRQAQQLPIEEHPLVEPIAPPALAEPEPDPVSDPAKRQK